MTEGKDIAFSAQTLAEIEVANSRSVPRPRCFDTVDMRYQVNRVAGR